MLLSAHSRAKITKQTVILTQLHDGRMFWRIPFQQSDEDVVEPVDTGAVQALLTFEESPTRAEVARRAFAIADIAKTSGVEARGQDHGGDQAAVTADPERAAK